MSDNKFNQEHFSETTSEQDKNNVENYTFIQETIRPKKKTRIKRLAFTIALGITFGGVACFTFCVSFPLFSNWFNLGEKKVYVIKETPISLSTPSPTKTPTPSSTPHATVTPEPTTLPTKGSEGNNVDNTSDSFLAQINSVKSVVGRSLVTVNGVKSGVDILNNPNEESNYTSGIIVYRDNSKILIMTNGDALDGASYITVGFYDGTVYKGELYDNNKQLGVALVRLDPNLLEARILESLVVAEMGDSAVASAGDAVIAMGNPNGYMNSLDYGVISNDQNDAYITDGKVQLINTTIPNNDNGYGFILDKKGKILGVITHKERFVSDLNANLNTCLSMSSIRPILERMIEKKDTLYLGLVCCDISKDIAVKLNLDKGVYVTKVEENSPAFLAGIKKGDVLLELNGVGLSSMSQYYNKLNELGMGRKVILKIMRQHEGKWVSMEVNAVIAKAN